MFTRAIVRPPGPNFSEGLTSVDHGADPGPPQFERAVLQHAAYCAALAQCGLAVTSLPPDPDYPDSTFVEDTAVLTQHCAVIARPGAPSRRGEVIDMSSVLANFYPNLVSIQEPGTLDGGDVCQAGNHFFVGLSARTNEAGAQQLADLLAQVGYTASLVDIRKIGGLLHLKSALAYLGDNRLVVTKALGQAAFPHYELLRVNTDEAYAANCIRVNDYVLLAAGYASFARTLSGLGYQTIALDISEFQKMDGGLSCLSLRF